MSHEEFDYNSHFGQTLRLRVQGQNKRPNIRGAICSHSLACRALRIHEAAALPLS